MAIHFGQTLNVIPFLPRVQVSHGDSEDAVSVIGEICLESLNDLGGVELLALVMLTRADVMVREEVSRNFVFNYLFSIRANLHDFSSSSDHDDRSTKKIGFTIVFDLLLCSPG